jgi:hypothetical protein
MVDITFACEKSATLLVSLLNSPMPKGSLALLPFMAAKPPALPVLLARNGFMALPLTTTALMLFPPAVCGGGGDMGIEATDAECARPPGELDDRAARDGEDADEAKMFDSKSLLGTLLRAGSGGGAAVFAAVLLGGGVTRRKKNMNNTMVSMKTAVSAKRNKNHERPTYPKSL